VKNNGHFSPIFSLKNLKCSTSVNHGFVATRGLRTCFCGLSAPWSMILKLVLKVQIGWHRQTPSSIQVQRQNLRVRTCREADHLMLIAIAGGQFPSTDFVSALLVEFQLIKARGGRLLSILVFPKLHIFYTLPMFYNTPGSSTIFPSKLV
jgi:hypothetical protein